MVPWIRARVQLVNALRKEFIRFCEKARHGNIIGQMRMRFLNFIRNHYREVLLFCADELLPSGKEPKNLVLTYGGINLFDLKVESIRDPSYLNLERLKKSRERRDRGDKLLTLRDEDGRICHCSWVRTSHGFVDIGELGESIQGLAEGELTIVFDCWTDPSMRGKGLYPWGIRYIANRAIENGSTCWIYCMRWNRPSRRGIEKAGFRCFGLYKRFFIFTGRLN